MFCPKCGHQNEPGAFFCSSCGYRDPGKTPPEPRKPQPAKADRNLPPFFQKTSPKDWYRKNLLLAVAIPLFYILLALLLTAISRPLQAYLQTPWVMAVMALPALGIGIGGLILIRRYLPRPETGLPKKTALLFLGLNFLCASLGLTLGFYSVFSAGGFILVIAAGVYLVLLCTLGILAGSARQNYGYELFYNLLRAFSMGFLPAWAMAYLLGRIMNILFLLVALAIAAVLFFFTNRKH